jgi:hypothetical protein
VQLTRERSIVRTWLVILLLAVPSSLRAQLVHGHVLEAESQGPVRLATLELLDDRDRVLVEAVSDSVGAFRVRAWIAGKYRIRASAIGYRTVTSDLLEIGTGDAFQLDIRLATDAVALEPISVVSRSRSSLTEIALRGYYDRRDAGRRIGMGRFLDRGEIEERGTKLSDVLRRVPGLRIHQNGRCAYITVGSNPGGTNRLDGRRTSGGECTLPAAVCAANLYLDGLQLNYVGAGASIDQMVPLDWVEAIEVYRRPSELPAEFLSSGACGVVSIWTRRG